MDRGRVGLGVVEGLGDALQSVGLAERVFSLGEVVVEEVGQRPYLDSLVIEGSLLRRSFVEEGLHGLEIDGGVAPGLGQLVGRGVRRRGEQAGRRQTLGLGLLLRRVTLEVDLFYLIERHDAVVDRPLGRESGGEVGGVAEFLGSVIWTHVLLGPEAVGGVVGTLEDMEDVGVGGVSEEGVVVEEGERLLVQGVAEGAQSFGGETQQESLFLGRLGYCTHHHLLLLLHHDLHHL